MKPSLRRGLIGVAALVGVVITTALGLWQWGRAQDKLGLQAAVAARAAQAPLTALELVSLADVQTAMHRPVNLQGSWEAQHTVYLDNRQMQARPGFYVLTPLRLAADKVVLVQRGWVPRDFVDRTRLPAVITPAGEVTVQGRLAPPPAKLYELAPGSSGLIRQNLDLALLRSETGLPVRTDLSVQQTGAASEGLLRDWPVAATTAAKNYGYAVQWWSLAGLIFCLYVWFQIIQPRRRAQAARS